MATDAPSTPPSERDVTPSERDAPRVVHASGTAPASLDPLDPSSDTRTGSSARGVAANAALRALSRAARSYTIYDARNEAVRIFIGEMLDAIESYVATYGDLILDVTPQELVLEGEQVYVERDRERSLASRLFRDGIRQISILQGVDWHQLVGLLEVLTIRFVGVRQFEDDLVTLISKAGLTHVGVKVIAGMVTSEEGEDGDAENDGLPLEFDLPEPVYVADEARATLSYQAPYEQQLEALQGELNAEAYAPQVLELTRCMLAATWTPSGEPPLEAAFAFARDARDYLMIEGDVQTLVELDDLLAERARDDAEATEALAAWRKELGSADFISRVLPLLAGRSAGIETGTAASGGVERVVALVGDQSGSAAFATLLSRPPCEPLPALLELLALDRPESEHRTLSAFLLLFARKHGAEIAARCRRSAGAYAARLLYVLAAGSPEHARELLSTLVRGGDREVQLGFLDLLERLSRGTEARTYLGVLLSASDEAVRLRTLRAIVALDERGAASVVESFAERRASEGASRDELEAAGTAFAALDPARALEAFKGWCEPQGLMSRVLRRHRPLTVAAAAGLALLADEEADRLLASLSSDASAATREATANAIARRAATPASARLRPRPPSKTATPSKAPPAPKGGTDA
jgi:hypothetical protein